jgi:hypothetical protein
VSAALLPLMAEASDSGLFRDWMAMDYRLFVILGTYLAVAAAVFIWAAFFRKRGRHRRSHRHRHSPAPAAQPVARQHRSSRWHLFRRHHRRRRRKFARNPTLAEARGLPPVRSAEQPPTLP